MRASRLFGLLEQLRMHRQPVSAAVLAETLGVSVRTIYRDIATLQSMGAPIRGEGGVGYQIERGYFLPPLHFDADELDAITLGMQLISARGDSDIKKAAARVAAKVDAIAPGGANGRVRQGDMIAYSKASEAQRHLAALRRAVRERRRLEIVYLDLKDQQSTRRVRPLGLTAFDQVWLLTAWCDERDDFRNFRVDRLATVTETGARFAPQAGREFRDYLKTLR
ncbi:WYL domain-containing protein [Nitratireductor aquimarinus]|uniref:WYL domain-containing protein n=1 Tax=Nitratireductor aquimarinus TaxID=889300 RepID=A0ABU4AJK9_9HYPH|nr:MULTISPECIES: WYL domain-containing protein [Nitratireductor]MDV6226425.1 WYL domain-containing protein [Nitratireductor aquimarinus]